jgi:hypothetical protein
MSLNFSYIKSKEEVEEEYIKLKDSIKKDSLEYYREIDIENNDDKRNYEIEKRIKLIEKRNKDYGINLYGGMAMDSVSNDVKLLRLEELKYMKENPHLYEYKRK